MSSIQILIPTYNRAEDLLKNLHFLSTQIKANNLQSVCAILISDNYSDDGTEEKVLEFRRNHADVTIDYYRNERNIGLEANVVNTFLNATAEHVLCLGDDDFLAEGYLRFCYDSIQQDKNVGCIVPGLQSLVANGSILKSRREQFDVIKLEKGYKTTFYYSHFGHQMSGLLFKRKSLLDVYLSKDQYRNPYLFIFFTAYCMLHYSTIYAPVYKTTVNAFNEKAWSYNGIGLLDEVYKSYYGLEDNLNASEIADLLIRFTVMHSYRLTIKADKPGLAVRQFLQVVNKSKDIDGFRRKLLLFFAKEYANEVRNGIKK